jgi:flagella basal body P-ring formation protein FlgA
MKRKHYDIGETIRRGVAAVAFVAALVLAASPSLAYSSQRSVTLHFTDSVMVNDSLIRVGDIARVESADAALAGRVREFSAGEAAPPGFSRFVNSEDLMMFRVRPQFRDVNFVVAASKRVKVISDHQDRSVAEFEANIRQYVAERLQWGDGEWELTINNLQSTWKSGRGPVSAEVSGINNPFAKGNMSLTLTVRQGSRVSRIPVTCRITVTAPVLVASRTIQRGEEFNSENSTTQVVDITNFAFTPLRRPPNAGTMTAMRTITAGNILHDKMLRAIPVVARGDQVRIHFVGGRVRVSVIGVARDSGGSGDRIWVENLQTGKLIRAAVSGKGSVVVHQEGDRS